MKLEELKYSMEADGVILQLPLPFSLTMDDFKDHMNPDKDVDGFLTDSPFAPCTPDGIMQMLQYVYATPLRIASNLRNLLRKQTFL